MVFADPPCERLDQRRPALAKPLATKGGEGLRIRFASDQGL